MTHDSTDLRAAAANVDDAIDQVLALVAACDDSEQLADYAERLQYLDWLQVFIDDCRVPGSSI